MSIPYEKAQTLFAKEEMPLTETLYRQFCAYENALVETNKVMNLTAITESEEVWVKHFLDCALLLKYTQIPLGASIIDVGTGAGFPGFCLAILRPDLQVTLLDSLQKRLTFLEDTAKKLGISNVQFVHARAEDGGKNADYREQFDFATARAVAPLPILLEYCIPFVKVGGQFLAMKGREEQAEPAEDIAEQLQCKLTKQIPYQTAAGERNIFIYDKAGETPKRFPRSPKKIKQANG